MVIVRIDLNVRPNGILYRLIWKHKIPVVAHLSPIGIVE
jgi:hypothetical protein